MGYNAVPVFVTFEGIEGSGKSTTVRSLSTWLEARDYDFLVTREPGGTPIGDRIREILLDPRNRALAPQAELHLYLADRAQHISQLVRPALDEGRTVLCDRFGDSTVAYQGAARGMGMDVVRALHDAVCGATRPDLTFLLDLPAEEGLRRARGRPVEGNTRLEEEDLRFHRRVRSGFLRIAGEDPDRVVVVDASRPAEVVFESVLTVFRSRIVPHMRKLEEGAAGP